MITLFTGSPGAGKTAALVDALMTTPEYIGRPLYVHGLDGLCINHQLINAATWSAKDAQGEYIVPDGALVVIDEVQSIWRARTIGAQVPDAVQALEVHRHRGLDFLLTTQAPALLDVNVRRLVGRHVHIRDTGILGRWWYEWPECSDAMDWQGAVNKRRWSLPKKAFTQYISASKHIKPVRSIPRIFFLVLICLILLVGLIYYVYGRLAGKLQPENSPGQVSPVTASAATVATGGPGGAPDVIMDFIPRLPGKPETAPAYDHLRKIEVLPVVAGGMCWGKTASETCRCFAPGGFDAPISTDECRKLVLNPLPYNPYQPKTLAVAMAAPAPPTDRQTGGPEAPNRGGP